jgi:divalent metal cation (Fe/Co/Zn/Cd) transporter
MTDDDQIQALEQRSLSTSKWSNLFMAAAGILAACLSNSQALLVDGLFSLIGFLAALIGAKISRDAMRDPDSRRPFGYAAEESAFVTFRALSLLALVVFAIFSAVQEILAYAQYGDARDLNYTVIVIYFLVIMAVCFGLAVVHRRSWVRTGRKSDILRIEAEAAKFDGILSFAAGAGLLGLPFLRGTPLDVIVPVGDSVIVLLLCLFLVGEYWREFRRGLGELLGVTARPRDLRTAVRAVRAEMEEDPGTVIDVALVKAGRQYEAAVFYDPARPVAGRDVDDLTDRLEAALGKVLGTVTVYVMISEYGRAVPEDEDTAGLGGALPAT